MCGGFVRRGGGGSGFFLFFFITSIMLFTCLFMHILYLPPVGERTAPEPSARVRTRAIHETGVGEKMHAHTSCCEIHYGM